ncbi:4-galactosyl-N-acetylglucosaminide 3-alpha-L-fucosyltransferase 9-like [Hoplias malabaricus]|uniref:4-galactosyl-N-acetylglucosaminide 3-alpha-L-fucosyltransferase 9-like n=1 Tax=Hoplias malabaricus TaxID=27720 RepID=UPI003461BD04
MENQGYVINAKNIFILSTICLGILLMNNFNLSLPIVQIITHLAPNLQPHFARPPNLQLQSAPPTRKKETIILIWFWPFRKHFDLHSCSSDFKIDGCYLTDDRAFYKKADGVIIHHWDIKHDMSNLPSEPRPYFQKWVWMHFESPKHTSRIEGLENLFNITMNYRRDADIPVHETMVFKTEDTEEDDVFPEVLQKKDKLVCWIVSNWNKEHDRVKYYNELKHHITIEAYGRAFNKSLNEEEYHNVLTTCKFYLSFENAKSFYYKTEKLFNPLAKGSVPVVLGPPRCIYETSVASDSFIHVDDFKTPKELANHLHWLDKNEHEYKKYFMWRKMFKIQGVNFPKEHVCRACEYIRRRNDLQVFTHLNKWYFDDENM